MPALTPVTSRVRHTSRPSPFHTTQAGYKLSTSTTPTEVRNPLPRDVKVVKLQVSGKQPTLYKGGCKQKRSTPINRSTCTSTLIQRTSERYWILGQIAISGSPNLRAPKVRARRSDASHSFFGHDTSVPPAHSSNPSFRSHDRDGSCPLVHRN